MKSLGLRHVALNVRDAQVAKNFYSSLFGMRVEWEPDPQSVYLTSAGQDNLALHESPSAAPEGRGVGLDHIGFVFADEKSVDELHAEALRRGVPVVKAPKKHRDGAYSFYLKDPDGYVIQAICHPPIVRTACPK